MARRTKKTKYSVVVIGTGKVGALYEAEPRRQKPASHAGVAVSNKQAKLVALVDRDSKTLAKAGRLFPKAARYADVQVCLQRERPDIVVIATPPSTHLALIGKCLRAGVKAIVCEKPLAQSVTQARAIAQAVSKSGVVFVLNYQRRLSPLLQRVRREITSGALGRIEQVTCYYSNGLYNNGGHALDALLYLLCETPAVQWAAANRHAVHPKGDPCVDAVLKTKSGTRIVLQSVDQRAYGIFDIRILGSKGERSLLDYSETLTATSARRSVYEGERNLDRARTTTRRGSPEHALSYAVRCLEHQTKPESGVANGLAVVELLEKIKKHAQKNK